eukprot:2781830-Prymnesium_polylepis.1
MNLPGPATLHRALQVSVVAPRRQGRQACSCDRAIRSRFASSFASFRYQSTGSSGELFCFWVVRNGREVCS